jgi:hypothetical protein
VTSPVKLSSVEEFSVGYSKNFVATPHTTFKCIKKGKAISIQAWRGPYIDLN